LGDLIAEHLRDAPRGKNTQLPLADLFRQCVYGRMAGYEDVNDAERLSQDPAIRLIGSERVWDRGWALTPDSPQRVVLDIHPTEIPAYGEQEKSGHNRHFESTCLSPAVVVQSRGRMSGCQAPGVPRPVR
jgi:hypothetical protein